jgi:hypothetical protein
MTDIFDNTILCSKCNKKMESGAVEKDGFVLRIVKCPNCNNKIVHPGDLKDYENFMELKNKEFNVKMRFVGNSYAVSIPKEIVNFMREQEKIMDDMVRLCFEEFGKVSLNFGTNNSNGFNNNLNGNNIHNPSHISNQNSNNSQINNNHNNFKAKNIKEFS